MRIEKSPVAAHRRTLVSIAVALAVSQYGGAFAAPVGNQVVAGQVTVTRPDPLQTVINQASQSAIVNWQQFSIAANERVDIRQPSASSVLLNRVIGNNPSEIYGRLSANGQVFLVNPNGVLFGRGAQVSVGGLVASTLDIANDDFLAGRFQFAGDGGAAVDNQGSLTAGARGTVALLGGRVNNDGTISAQLGTAALVAGEKIALDFQGDGLTKIRVDQGAVAALVANRGMIIADGGQAVMSASAAQALADTVLNQQGVIRARSLVERDGKIVLDGGAHGVSVNSGALDATGGAGLKGGTVNLLGHHVGLVGQAVLDVSGAAGGGSIFIGGGVQGANPLLRNAAATFAGAQVTLRADALAAGKGGTVVLWSDGATRMFGAASARGGAAGGDGGFIETSGKFLDVAGARIDAASPLGKGGNWLLDPYDLYIVAPTSIPPMPTSPNFVSDGSHSALMNTEITDVLDAGTSVTVTTGAGGSEEGTIRVQADIVKTTGGDATLTLNAATDIIVDQGIRIESTAPGRLHVDLNADADASDSGGILIGSGAVIASNGGNVRLYGQNDPVNGFATGSSSDFVNGVYLESGATIDTTAVLQANAGGNISIRGRGVAGKFNADGVVIDNALLATESGAIAVTGISGEGGRGVYLPGSTIATRGGGSIDLRGMATPDPDLPSYLEGIFTDDATIYTSGGPGAIVLSGQSVSGRGLSLGGTQLGDATTTGDITLRAFATDTGAYGQPMLMMPDTLQTTGVVNLRPGGVNASGALTANNDVPIDIGGASPAADTFALAQSEIESSVVSGASALIIGGLDHTGVINVATTGPFGAGWNLTLQNGGAGSAGINLTGALDLTGRQLTLSSGGGVAQSGPIVADSVLLHGTRAASNFFLFDGGNTVNTLAAALQQPRGAGATDGDVTFFNSVDLQLGPLSAFGMNSVTNLRQLIDSTGNTNITGDLLVESAAGLTVATPINMQSASFVRLDAANDLNIGSVVNVNGPASSTTFEAGGSLFLPGAINITGNNSSLALRALGDLDTSGVITFYGSGADLLAMVDGDATIGGSIDMRDVDSVVTMNVANDAYLTGSISTVADAVLEVNAQRDLNAQGSIAMGDGALFSLNAGADVEVSGNINTTGGTNVQTINAGRDITVSAGGNLVSSAGPLHLDFNSDADNVDGGAIAFTPGSSLSTRGGDVRLFGQSNPLTGFASGSTFGQLDGIVIDTATLDMGGGALTMRGQGLTRTFSDDSGTSFDYLGAGVLMYGASISTGSGGLSARGIGGQGGDGIWLEASVLIANGAGPIDMRGRGGAPYGASVGAGLTSVDTSLYTDAGDIALSGESNGGSGMAFSGFSEIGRAATSGNIVLRAFQTGASAVSTPMLALGGTIATGGVVNIRPGGVSATGALTEEPATVINIGGVAAAGEFALSQAALDAAIAPGTAGVVIGSAAQSGAINVTALGPLSGDYDLTLQNDASGSGGINLFNGLSIAGRLLTLSSGGAVTQSGPIVAGGLLLRGTQPASSFSLNHAANVFGNVSTTFLQGAGSGATDGNVSIFSGTDLQVGPLAGFGFDGATNLAQNIASAGTVVGGDLVLSSGGDLTLIEDVGMLTGGSSVTLNAARDIILAQDTGIGLATPSGTLRVDFNADSDGVGGGAIVVSPLASIVTNGGDVRFYGQSDAANGYASGSSSSSPDGVSIAGTIDAGPGGSVTMRGRGFSGGAAAGNGVALDGATISSGSGPIAITGIGALGGTGVRIASSQLDTGTGAIDVRGRAGVDTSTSAGSGVVLSGSAVRASAGATAISGEAFGGSGVAAFGTGAIGGAASSGNIVLRALNTGSARTLDVGGTIQTSGLVNLRPGGVSATGALTEAPATVINIGGTAAAGEFSMTDDVLVSRIGAGTPTVIVGSAAQTGAINVLASAPLGGGYDLTLQNDGAGNGGINLYNGLSIPGRMLTLSSGGSVTQGAAIVAGRLLLHGTQAQSSFQLANPANAVGRFSSRFEVLKGTAPTDGDVNFASAGNLEIGPMTGLGFDAGTGLVQSFEAADAVVAGDIVAQAGGNMTLRQNVTTLGSDITLVAGGVLLNPVNATLNPGGSGRWRVFADTWVGEVDGGLTGTAPTPNFYNCQYGAACATTLPVTNNYFVYRQQPVIDVVLTTPTQTRVYGAANPPFPFTASGLVKGDTLAASLSGAYAAPAAVDVGAHAVNGAFTSPVGYLINAAPGTLNVTPATLTYVAAPATRHTGEPNPPFTGAVTGLVNNDTLAGAATGTLLFTSAAPAGAPVGQYAIDGGGLTARNYVFQQAPANLTALTVDKVPFTVLSIAMPSIVREVSLPASDLYGANFGVQRACVGSGPLAGPSGAGDANDTLAMEWSRVRGTPNLSNCIGMVQRYSCGDF